MSTVSSSERYLPFSVHKQELKNYFGCSYRQLWGKYITDQMLVGWGFDPMDRRRNAYLHPDLTEKIYRRFRITDLKGSYSDEISRRIQKDGAFQG